MIELDDKAFLGKGWAFPLAIGEGDEVALAAYEEDVREAILIILQTSPGERVMRPEFGAGLQAFTFELANTTTMALVKHRVQEALVAWEPRIDVLDVQVTLGLPERNRLDIEISYRIRATNTFYNLVYPFYLLEGERT
jgi:phage baseplate assembly protein W